MTSYYSYSGNVRRRWGNLNFNAGASFGHSGLTNEPGTDSSSQGYTSSFGYGRWINLTGNYGKSNGVGLITGNGILPVNLSPILPQNLITLYGGTGYGVSLSSIASAQVHDCGKLRQVIQQHLNRRHRISEPI